MEQNIISTDTNTIKKIDSLSLNDEKKEQGNGYIGISPFDDYFLFNVFKEIEGEDVAMDLSKVGTLYINFYGESEDVKIKNYTNVEDIDLTQGQVLFKITKSDGKKILKFKDNSFYISSRLEVDNQISDETVIYTGKYYEFRSIPDIKNTDQISTITAQANAQITTLTKLNDLYKKDNIDKQNDVNTLTNANSILIDLTNALYDEFDIIMNKLSTDDRKALNTRLNELKAKSDNVEKNLNDFVNKQNQNRSEKELETLVKNNNATDLTKITSNTQIKSQV